MRDTSLAISLYCPDVIPLFFKYLLLHLANRTGYGHEGGRPSCGYPDSVSLQFCCPCISTTDLEHTWKKPVKFTSLKMKCGTLVRKVEVQKHTESTITLLAQRMCMLARYCTARKSIPSSLSNFVRPLMEAGM